VQTALKYTSSCIEDKTKVQRKGECTTATQRCTLVVDLIHTAFDYSFTEGLVKQNQLPDGARQPTAKYV